MTRGRLRARLLIALAAFAAWIGYMGYLVASRPRTPEDEPLVLSRAQLLASDADVIAFVASPDEPVKIEKVLWAGKGVALADGQVLKVDNIARAQPRAASRDAPDPAKDYAGPGRYLIPLTYRPRSKEFSVARVPESPGFYAPPWTEQDRKERDEGTRAEPEAWYQPATRWPVYRIYPATEEAEAQYARHKPGL
jgi:hypothetical protein